MSDDDVPLFDLPDGAHRPEQEDGLSADGRRRVRQARAVLAGVHPLALVVTGVQMHPDADRDAARTDRPNLPLRCGSCWYRQDNHRGYPACAKSPTRQSHGAATDVRAWWPACTDYSPGDPAQSVQGGRA